MSSRQNKILLVSRIAILLPFLAVPDFYKAIIVSAIALSFWAEAIVAPKDRLFGMSRSGFWGLAFTNLAFAIICTIIILIYWLTAGRSLLTYRVL